MTDHMEPNMATKNADGVPFDIHLKGLATGKTWDGKFRAKPILTFREQMASDKLRRELIGTDSTDVDIVAQGVILSELRFRLTDAPEWWTSSNFGMDLADPNLLQEIYKDAKRIEQEHMKALETEAEKAREVVKVENAAAPKV